MLIDESIYETIEMAEKKTARRYTDKIYWKDKEQYDGYIEAWMLLGIIEDLLGEIDEKEEYIKYLQEETDPNYDYYEEQKIREAEERGEI